MINALNTRVAIDRFLLRNLGSKKRIKDYRFVTSGKNMVKEDKETLENILEKYEINTVVDEFPQWYIGDVRHTIRTASTKLVHNIIKANSIYPTTVAEYHERRIYQDKAINYCEILFVEFQHISQIIDVDIEKFTPYIEMLEKEIKLLKGWRKKDNKLLKQIEEKGRK